MPENKSRPPQDQPWEQGWAPDTSRAPGTRRLWLAGGLAVATVVACVTAIAVNDQESDGRSDAREARALSGDPTSDGLISFATPSASVSGATSAAGDGKEGGNSASPSVSSSPSAAGDASSAADASDDSSPSPHTSGKASASPTRKPSEPTPTSYERSVQSVNYPDRYWHLSSGLVKLDPLRGSESREDSTFTVVKGLTDSACYSFKTDDGRYLRHRNFVLRADSYDGSALFKQDATFCARSSSYSGAVMLESVNYPGRYLRHKDFQVRLDSYQNSGLYRADSAFRFVAGVS
ncbi:AbfB domain-containing protein [Streptomyces sp. NBC_00582]|uniref:AbfB domain-containing protein n=1 Tax=Streptomyces sp. NBC_00582 TaxID=2975783 RepID=UPI001062F675|nr:AbfB domain-containing protein [Streptomyces sp. NBC_00582]WUB65545.1 AbfB domain-containing protein [Streptomyces sp. NBC_00582]